MFVELGSLAPEHDRIMSINEQIVNPTHIDAPNYHWSPSFQRWRKALILALMGHMQEQGMEKEYTYEQECIHFRFWPNALLSRRCDELGLKIQW